MRTEGAERDGQQPEYGARGQAEPDHESETGTIVHYQVRHGS
jgi:hypothetical protein